MTDTLSSALSDQYRHRLDETIRAAVAQGMDDLATALYTVRDSASELAACDHAVRALTEHRYRFFYPVD